MKLLLVFAGATLLAMGCSSSPLGSPGTGGATGGAGAGTGGAGGSASAASAGGSAGRDAGTDTALGTGGQSDDDALIVPQGLDVELEQGGAGTFTLQALTLRDESDGLANYASLDNTGDVAACDAAFKVQLFDKNDQPLGSYISGLYTSHFYLYTLPDGSTTIAACASVGDVSMAKIDTMATNITVADVGKVVYYYTYFVLDSAVLIEGLTLSQANGVMTDAGTAYAGTMVNNLSTTVTGPSVTVFTLTHVGRPLDMVRAEDSSQVPAGGSWPFQTSAPTFPGVDFAAFPSASFSN